MFDRKQYDREYYQKNKSIRKTQVSKIDSRRRERYREFIWNYLSCHPCVDCGETDPIVLQFDHQRDKIMNISSMVAKHWPIETIQEEMVKCEIRCANCHLRKTAKDRSWYKNQVGVVFNG